MEIKALLKNVGVIPNVKGYYYLVDAIATAKKAIEQEDIINGYMDLYHEIGKKYGVTGKSVERCIRYCVSNCWENKTDTMKQLFVRNIKMPSCSCFIAVLAEFLVLEGSIADEGN